MYKNQNFTEGKIFAPLIRFAVPVSWLMSKRVPVSLFHIGLATPVASAVQICLCMAFFASVEAVRRRRQMRT